MVIQNIVRQQESVDICASAFDNDATKVAEQMMKLTKGDVGEDIRGARRQPAGLFALRIALSFASFARTHIFMRPDSWMPKRRD